MTPYGFGYEQSDDDISSRPETLWRKIRAIANEWETQFSNKLHSTENIEENLAQFYIRLAALFKLVEEKLPQPGSHLECVLACCMIELGPKTPEAPPVEMWTSLCQVAGALVNNTESEPMIDLVIAWGCGWGRTVCKSGNAWDRRWTDAILMFSRLVERSVNETVKKLLAMLGDNSYIKLPSEEIRLYTNLIAMEIANDRCRCGNHTQEGKRRADHASCQCCRHEHKLSQWRPDLRLRAFVAQAVRGSATKELMTGSFSSGALYPLLEQDFGITIGLVEFKECHQCKKKYEGNRCPDRECNTAFNPQQTRRLERKNWLFIPYDRGGPYTLINRWHCQNCDNLFSVKLESCPICGHGRPIRPTHIWIYQTKKSTPDSEINRDLEDLA